MRDFIQLLQQCIKRLGIFFSSKYKVVFFSRLFERSFTLDFFRYFFPFVSFVFVSFVLLAISFFFLLEERKVDFEKQLALSAQYEKHLEELDVYSKLISQYQGDYESILVEIFKNLANYRNQNNLWDKEEGYKWEKSGDELHAHAEAHDDFHDVTKKSSWDKFVEKWRLGQKYEWQDDDYAESLDKMQKVTARTRVTLEHLKDIQSYFNLRDTLKKNIPNGWPLKKMIGKVTSRYGPRYSPFSKKVEFHEGVDIGGVPKDSVVVATADAVVSFAGEKGGFGFVVILRHKYGHETVYAHNSKVFVRVGQKVKKGQPIAHIGSSGRSTGIHLHYEVRLKKEHVDPWIYVIADF